MQVRRVDDKTIAIISPEDFTYEPQDIPPLDMVLVPREYCGTFEISSLYYRLVPHLVRQNPYMLHERIIYVQDTVMGIKWNWDIMVNGWGFITWPIKTLWEIFKHLMQEFDREGGMYRWSLGRVLAAVTVFIIVKWVFRHDIEMDPVPAVFLQMLEAALIYIFSTKAVGMVNDGIRDLVKHKTNGCSESKSENGNGESKVPKFTPKVKD